MTKKILRQNRSHEAASSADRQSELPYLPTLTLCMLHQLLNNLQRIELSIRRTTTGDYALIVNSKHYEASDVDPRLAIVPTEWQLRLGHAYGTEPSKGDVRVDNFLIMGLGADDMLNEVVHAAAAYGSRPKGAFAETLATFRGLKEPRFEPFIEYLRPLRIADIRDELADPFQP